VQELQKTVSSATQIFYINCWMVRKKMKFMICVWQTKLIFLSTDSWINKISTTVQKKTVSNCICNHHTVWRFQCGAQYNLMWLLAHIFREWRTM